MSEQFNNKQDPSEAPTEEFAAITLPSEAPTEELRLDDFVKKADAYQEMANDQERSRRIIRNSEQRVKEGLL